MSSETPRLPDPFTDAEYAARLAKVREAMAAAGLDVLAQEPGFDRRFAELPNVALTPHMASATVETRNAMGRRALAVSAHVGRWDEIDRLVDQSYDRFGHVDILVNNAGMSPTAPSSLETSEELFDKIVALNFKGPFRLSANVATRMKAAGGGSVISVSTTGALRPMALFGPYAGSKAGLNAICVAFAQEFAPEVRFNVISPGAFYTDISKAWAKPGEPQPTPLGRFGHPGEVVTAALYYASDASSYTTGSLLRVDGLGQV